MNLSGVVVQPWRVGRTVIEWEDGEIDNASSTATGSDVAIEEMALARP